NPAPPSFPSKEICCFVRFLPAFCELTSMEELQDSSVAAPEKSAPKAKAWLKSEAAVRTADLLAGGLAIALIFWWLQYSTDAICCGDYDGYYHIKWARLLWDNMRAGHFPPAFPWLPLKRRRKVAGAHEIGRAHV